MYICDWRRQPNIPDVSALWGALKIVMHFLRIGNEPEPVSAYGVITLIFFSDKLLVFLFLFCFFLLVHLFAVGHTWQWCSGLTPSSVLRNYSWQSLRNYGIPGIKPRWECTKYTPYQLYFLSGPSLIFLKVFLLISIIIDFINIFSLLVFLVNQYYY